MPDATTYQLPSPKVEIERVMFVAGKLIVNIRTAKLMKTIFIASR